MKLSDYQRVDRIDIGGCQYLTVAEVTVTTGAWFWRKSVRRKIARKTIGAWHFVDSGELTPGSQAEALDRACESQGIIERNRGKP